jgi:hypothetical protein
MLLLPCISSKFHEYGDMLAFAVGAASVQNSAALGTAAL